MTLLWFDGFEGQDHTLTWTSVTSTWTNTATGTRLGYGRLIQSAGNSRSIQQTITASTDTYVGFAMKVTAIGDSFVDFYGDSNVTRHIRIAVAASGAIEIRNGATTTVLATSAATGLVVAGTWVYLEVHVKVSDTVGEVNVRVNGASTDAVSFSGDTKNAGTNTTIDSVRFLTPNAGSPIFALDDVYICNGLGSLNNGFLGDCRVQLSQPTGAGSSTGLTPSTGSNYQTVDEIPFSATDYSGSAVVGARDTYAMTDLVAGSQAPKGVRVVVGWHKSDAGAANMKRAAKIGSTVYYGTSTALPTSMAVAQELLETNPDTAGAWTASAFNGAEFGAEVS